MQPFRFLTSADQRSPRTGIAYNGLRIGDVRALKYQSLMLTRIYKKKGESSIKYFRPAIANALLWVGYKRSKNAAAAEHPPPPLSM